MKEEFEKFQSTSTVCTCRYISDVQIIHLSRELLVFSDAICPSADIIFINTKREERCNNSAIVHLLRISNTYGYLLRLSDVFSFARKQHSRFYEYLKQPVVMFPARVFLLILTGARNKWNKTLLCTFIRASYISLACYFYNFVYNVNCVYKCRYFSL